MSNQLLEAIAYIHGANRSRITDEAVYRQNCEFIIAHRDALTQQVFVNIPGGLSSNTDPAWDHVRANTRERCSCGNERVILPANPRSKFLAAVPPVILTIRNGEEVTLRPVGGDLESSHMTLKMHHEAIELHQDPFAPFVMTADIFSTPGYSLETIAQVMRDHPGEELVMFTGAKAPLFQITGVNPADNTLTILLDAAVEAFDAEKESRRHPDA